ncbi:adhesion G-protein coupled receptor G5-like isoform X2 [Eleginops maclovinus]|uniref:adhesion G-protein coupled receptor G5-like isoform X2 n=1 Tax=Eleginops maclovinus TaxID=56733 RepID=UPI003080C378
MKRMKSWLLCWMVLSLVSQNITWQNPGSNNGSGRDSNSDSGQGSNSGSSQGSNNGSGQGSNNGSGQGSNSGSSQGSNNGSGQGSNNGSGQGSNNGSGQGSNNGSGQGSNNGSGQGSNNGSGQGSNKGSGQGSNNGSGQGSNNSSGQGSNNGSGQGSNNGSGQGSNNGSGQGSNNSSGQGSNNGSGQGSNNGSGQGSNKGSGQGSNNGSGQGSNNGSGQGSNNASGQGSNNGSGQGSNNGSGQGSNKGSGQGSNNGSGQGSNNGSGQGSNNGSVQGSNNGSGQGSNKGSGQGSNNGSGQGSNKGSGQGSNNGSGQGSNKGSGQGSNNGSGQGSNNSLGQGSNNGSGQGSNNGSGQGSNKGSGQGSTNGSGQGSNNGSGQGSNNGSGQGSNNGSGQGSNKGSGQGSNNGSRTKVTAPLEEMLENRNHDNPINNLVAYLYKPKGPFKGLKIDASENEARSMRSGTDSVMDTKVSIQLPRELDAGSENTIVFCMFTWPEANWSKHEASDELYESRLVGLSVRGKNISGLQERVNITLAFTVNEMQKPSCVYLNEVTNDFSTDGCLTLWEPGQSNITCSCDHLTYFAVLMVSAPLSQTDLQILTYITQIGCSISLFALIITVLLFITKRKVRADISMKVHINLAIALILLNVHFLPSQTVAAQYSKELCFYIAVSLHYSLLATFSWMALEGLHLYLLLVRVFNIYIRKYLLKLSVVGWGLPAVIVALVVIFDQSSYGRVPLDTTYTNSTQICYIRDTKVKMVTTVGVFGLVFLLNVIMLGVTVRRIVSLHKFKKYGQSDSNRAKKDICMLLGVTTLLGITWGLVFFSFGYLTMTGLYLFCILNSLQGFFMFLWFLMSLRKKGALSTKSSVTSITNT